MKIDYTKVIRNTVEPTLAHHGFKYNEEESSPPTGRYSFRRNYWGRSQYINISRVTYNVEDAAQLIAEGSDIPTEIPNELLLVDEPDYRLWLSHRYIQAAIGQDGGGGSDITRTGLGEYSGFKQLAGLSLNEAQPLYLGIHQKHIWWEFRSEAELREVLRRIIEIVLVDGLEWFEGQVADIRRYHEKLEARLKAEKERRDGKAKKA